MLSIVSDVNYRFSVLFLFLFISVFSMTAYASVPSLTDIRALVREEKWEKALQLLKGQLRDAPELGEAYLLLGKVYEKMGMKYNTLAQKAYLFGAAKPETKVRGRLLLGASYFRRKEYKRAAGAINKALTAMPHDSPLRPRVFLLLGRSLFEDGDYNASIKALATAKKLKETPGSLYYLGLAHEKKNLYDKALEYYESLRDKFPRDKLVRAAKERESKILRGKGGRANVKDPEVRKLLKMEITQKKYPNAGAVILLNDVNTIINPDKSSTTTIHKIVKILNDRGKKYGEVDLDYDSSYESVTVDFARTITKSGKVITVGEKSIRDLAPWAGYPLYSNARMRVISMPEVMEGSVLEYKATWHTAHLVDLENYQTSHGLQVFEPKVHDKFKITVPKTLKLNVKYKNYPVTPSSRIWEEGENTVFLWDNSDIEEIISEPGMPPWSDITPMFYVSSFKSWQQIGKWFWKLAKTQFAPNAAIKAKVAELTSGAASDYEKTREIFNYVASKIRYVGIEYGESGYKPHKASEIFENKYGDCKDQATLLVTMLKTVGIESQLVLLRTQDAGAVFMGLPMIQFNHCIAMAIINGKKVWMDPTYSTASFDYLPWNDQDCFTMVMYKSGSVMEKTPLLSYEKTSIIKNVKLELFPNKSIKGEFSFKTCGEFTIHYRGLKYYKPKKRKDFFQNMVSGVYPGGKIVSHTISDLDDLNKPLEVSVAYTAPEGFKVAGPLGIFKMPSSKKAASHVALEERVYPIVLSGTLKRVSDVSVRVPNGYTVRFIPDNIDYSDKFGSVSASYKQSGEVISYHSEIRTIKTRIEKDEYKAYKERQERIAKESDQPVIFELTKKLLPFLKKR